MLYLDIRHHGIEMSEGVRERLTRRLEFALGRFSRRLGRIRIHLSGLNGDHGGNDKRCCLVARVQRGGEVVVEDRDGDLDTLIDRTCNRMGQAVLRELGRRREARRDRGMMR